MMTSLFRLMCVISNFDIFVRKSSDYPSISMKKVQENGDSDDERVICERGPKG